MEDYLKNTLSYEHWKKVGIYPHHGFCIPLSAIRTKNNCGIGEFPDLFSLIDFCSCVKMDVIQLLAINECGLDPSPYNAITSCGLDPIFIGLSSLPYLSQNPSLLSQIKAFIPYQKTQRVNFSLLRKKKMGFLKEYFYSFSEEISKDKEYESFKEQNSWLIPYSLFRVLSDQYQTNHWKKWPKEVSSFSEEKFQALLKEKKHEMEWYFFVQYIAYSQMIEAKTYATKKGVFLMGDIPILLSPDSVDVWKDRSLFDLDHIAGAPPDPLNPAGQKWGSYLFNWDALEKSDYYFLKRRLLLASKIYHLYRIDHALGFFRMWGIPPNKQAKEGTYLPKENEKWEPLGRKNLTIILQSCPILPIAEDLGTVPSFVGKVLKDFGICGMKILRWQQEKKEGRIVGYRNLPDYEPLSLTSLGTHDTSLLQLWWKEKNNGGQSYANSIQKPYNPELSSEMRMHLLWSSHHTSSLFHVNLLGEYLALFDDLVWENPEDERINRPGTISDMNWTYRMRPFIEDLLTHEKLKQKIHTILKSPSPPF